MFMRTRHKKQIFFTSISSLAILLVTGAWGASRTWESCMSYELYQGNKVLRCLEVSLFSEPQQYISLLVISLLLSLIPLFFLKKGVYRAWRMFAVIFIPLAALFIFAMPESSGSGWAFPNNLITREIASAFSAGAFLSISLLIIIIKSWRLKGK